MQEREGKFILLFALLFSFCLQVRAQELRPEGTFLADSFKLGKPVPYSLSFKYPSDLNIIFPDTAYDFSPFEISHRDYFYTRSDNGASLDSVVYYLRTFELDTVQKLTLPVYVVKNRDSTAIFAQIDSLIFDQVVPVMPDSVNLRETSYFHDVETAFNYPYFIAISVAIVIVIGILFYLFGDKIKRAFKLYRLKKEHDNYLAKYYLLLDRLNGENKSEEILSTWKRYLENLEKVPYTKLTTKEILAAKPDEALKTALRSVDRAIYSGHQDENMINQYQKLLDYSINAYQQKIDMIKHGSK